MTHAVVSVEFIGYIPRKKKINHPHVDHFRLKPCVKLVRQGSLEGEYQGLEARYTCSGPVETRQAQLQRRKCNLFCRRLHNEPYAP